MSDFIEAPKVKSVNCWWGHKWTKWHEYKRNFIVMPTTVSKEYTTFEKRQRRTCLKCGKIEEEVIY